MAFCDGWSDDDLHTDSDSRPDTNGSDADEDLAPRVTTTTTSSTTVVTKVDELGVSTTVKTVITREKTVLTPQPPRQLPGGALQINQLVLR